MKKEEPKISGPPRYPIETWMVLGIGLGASHLFYQILTIVGLYFVLKRLQPFADSALLTVTSVLIGTSIIHVYQMIVWHPELFRFQSILEPFAVMFVATSLVFTLKKGWAYPLILYLSCYLVLLFIALTFHIPKKVNPRTLFLSALVYLSVLWLLMRWFRMQTPNIIPTLKK
jgi:hypothetical protein